MVAIKKGNRYLKLPYTASDKKEDKERKDHRTKWCEHGIDSTCYACQYP